VTDSDIIAALACEDCCARLHLSRGRGIAGPVLVAVVEHELTCPWMARVAPEGVTMSGSSGVLMHVLRDTAEQAGSVGDDR
jgi:hypothetical protein